MKCNKYLIIVGKCSIINTCNKSAEPGQNRNIAALTFNFYVHIFFGDNMKDKYIKVALEEAKIAYDLNEVPVGAVIVKDYEIIAKSHNLKKSTNSITNHAEIISIIEASSYVGDWRLNDCELYVTLEPCLMCCGAIIASRLKKVYFGAFDKNYGCAGSKYDFLYDKSYECLIEHEGGILESECKKLITDFFQKIRKTKRKGKIRK